MMQYLETLAQLECQVYTLDRVKNRLDWQIGQLGHPQIFPKPVNPKSKWSVRTILGTLWFILTNAIPAILVIALVSLVAWFAVAVLSMLLPLVVLLPICYISGCDIPYFGHLYDILNENVTPVLIPVLVTAGGIFLVVSEEKQVKKRYPENLKTYEENVATDKLRVQKELEVKAELCAQRDAVLTEYWSAKNALDALYGLDIIVNEEKYRSFVAVTTFYSYFHKEYVDRLLGPRQAYDRYDEELKHGEIICKLDEITKNQAYMIDLLQDSNNTLRRIEQGNKKMLDSMERTEDNIELIEYNTKCAARSSETTAMLTAFELLRKHDE